MKVAFLCASLEPGRDGVGDYTRRLAGELIRRGHACLSVALNDSHISEEAFELQAIENISIPAVRLPSLISWSQRTIKAHKCLREFDPAWTSLQFVPFGFQHKGLCFGLGKQLLAMNTSASWHVMFHELWLGLAEKASFKERLWGALQRVIILKVMGSLRPRIVHTQTESYLHVLRRENINASILPLFSNIPLREGDGWESHLEPLIAESLGKKENRSELYLAGVLGSVNPEWSAEKAVITLLPLAQRFHKKLALVFLGRNNLTPKEIGKLRLKLENRAYVIMAGERTSFEISIILQSLDLGLATTPRRIIQKSGSVAAMLDHGLPVLVTLDDWRLRGTLPQPEELLPRFLSLEQFALLERLPTRACASPGNSTLERVAHRMLMAMQ